MQSSADSRSSSGSTKESPIDASEVVQAKPRFCHRWPLTQITCVVLALWVSRTPCGRPSPGLRTRLPNPPDAHLVNAKRRSNNGTHQGCSTTRHDASPET